MMDYQTAVRGAFFDIAGVAETPDEVAAQARYLDDGLLFLQEGKIIALLPWHEGETFLHPLKGYVDLRGKLLLPGFVDAHVHYPQTEMIGAFGEQLLEWLTTYTFPVESQFADADYAQEIAQFFVNQLISHGTTTALVFCTLHPASAEALFSEALRLNMRLIAGKVMMDRNAPDYLLDTAESSYVQSKQLIERWHGNGRLLYAITPRFAPTSTPEQLAMARRLREEFPTTYLHTHLCENKDEIAWVKSLFPAHKGYLDVYHQHGLTGHNCVFAHCVHLEEQEWDCLKETNSTIAFCPTSNLYLGSGLFKLHKAWRKQVKVGMGTDIGAGTTFNMLQTLNEAYKVMQLQGERLSAYQAFYLATLGGAHSLGLDEKIGSFAVGKEADFVVLDPVATPLQQLRYDNSTTLRDKLFVLLTLGDDRSIYRTYVDGQLVHERG